MKARIARMLVIATIVAGGATLGLAGEWRRFFVIVMPYLAIPIIAILIVLIRDMLE